MASLGWPCKMLLSQSSKKVRKDGMDQRSRRGTEEPRTIITARFATPRVCLVRWLVASFRNLIFDWWLLFVILFSLDYSYCLGSAFDCTTVLPAEEWIVDA
jgi:hypothetical protein